jgi:Cu(I)/Ag(I) efflux system membrane fusion protein
MKKPIVILFIAALSGAATLHASDAMKAIVGSYLEIQARLAGDKIEGIKPAAQAIGEQAARMGKSGDDIVKTAKALEQAADLKTARDAFGPLSDAVIAAGNAENWKDVPDVRVAYCPMVKRSWVQKEETIRNPYFGASMLSCGEFKKSK